jgi:hypothetical protein
MRETHNVPSMGAPRVCLGRRRDATRCSAVTMAIRRCHESGPILHDDDCKVGTEASRLIRAAHCACFYARWVREWSRLCRADGGGPESKRCGLPIGVEHVDAAGKVNVSCKRNGIVGLREKPGVAVNKASERKKMEEWSTAVGDVQC